MRSFRRRLRRIRRRLGVSYGRWKAAGPGRTHISKKALVKAAARLRKEHKEVVDTEWQRPDTFDPVIRRILSGTGPDMTRITKAKTRPVLVTPAVSTFVPTQAPTQTADLPQKEQRSKW